MTTGFIMYALIYVISGISLPESQTFLLAKRPSTAMNEEKRLSLAGVYYHMIMLNLSQ